MPFSSRFNSRGFSIVLSDGLDSLLSLLLFQEVWISRGFSITLSGALISLDFSIPFSGDFDCDFDS